MTTTEKLNHLADWLEEKVTDDTLDMTRWINECGTVGCALGWATMIPEFNEMGLKQSRRFFDEVTPVYKDKDGVETDGYDAADAFFNIGYGAARHTFCENAYHTYEMTLKTVIGRIRATAEIFKDAK